VTPPPIERDGTETATGFNRLFEWMVSAEAACERGVNGSDAVVSQALHDVNQQDSNGRIRRFYSERFNSSPNNVIASFTAITNGLLGDEVPWDPTEWPLKVVSGATSTPKGSDAETCARVYADFLTLPTR